MDVRVAGSSQKDADNDLLRFITCGSVDDGKSTLIGRLLHDSKQIFEDQLSDAGQGFGAPRHNRRGYRLRAAGRRPGSRARAGHHHRRRLPLLRHAAPFLHRRRYARPRAIYPQHGDRRVQCRARGHPDRRAQGRAGADQAAFLHLLAARHPTCGGGGEQDRPGRITARKSSTASSPITPPSPRSSASPSSCRSRSPRALATM